MEIKIVIATHPAYKAWLKNILYSLNYLEYLNNIIVSVSNVPIEKKDEIVQDYKNEFNLINVLTYHTNIDEYTSFVAVGNAIQMGILNIDDKYLMLHDTVEAGPRFWKQIDEVCSILKSKEDYIDIHVDIERENHIIKINDFPSTFRYSPTAITDSLFKKHGIRLNTQNNIQTIECTSYYYHPNEHVLIGNVKQEIPLYLGKDMKLVPNINEAIIFPDINSIKRILCLEKNIAWYPLCDSFNMGFASGNFLANTVYPKLKDVTFDKYIGIDIEHNLNHKYNLKNMAIKWQYILPDKHNVYSNNRNDTDVLGNGKKRTVAYLHSLDLRKFFYFFDKNKEEKHEFRN